MYKKNYNSSSRRICNTWRSGTANFDLLLLYLQFQPDDWSSGTAELTAEVACDELINDALTSQTCRDVLTQADRDEARENCIADVQVRWGGGGNTCAAAKKIISKKIVGNVLWKFWIDNFCIKPYRCMGSLYTNLEMFDWQVTGIHLWFCIKTPKLLFSESDLFDVVRQTWSLCIMCQNLIQIKTLEIC